MNTKLRIAKTSYGKYIVQQKFLFWWPTIACFDEFQMAHDHAVAFVRGNGTIMCKVETPAITIIEYVEAA